MANLANFVYDKEINFLNVFLFNTLRLLFPSNVGSNPIFQSLPSALLLEKIFFSLPLFYFINNESSRKTWFVMLLLAGRQFAEDLEVP